MNTESNIKGLPLIQAKKLSQLPFVSNNNISEIDDSGIIIQIPNISDSDNYNIWKNNPKYENYKILTHDFIRNGLSTLWKNKDTQISYDDLLPFIPINDNITGDSIDTRDDVDLKQNSIHKSKAISLGDIALFIIQTEQLINRTTFNNTVNELRQEFNGKVNNINENINIIQDNINEINIDMINRLKWLIK